MLSFSMRLTARTPTLLSSRAGRSIETHVGRCLIQIGRSPQRGLGTWPLGRRPTSRATQSARRDS